MISPDEESDADDTDYAEDDEADMADHLPSIPDIIAKQGVDDGRADTTGKQAQSARAYFDGR